MTRGSEIVLLCGCNAVALKYRVRVVQRRRGSCHCVAMCTHPLVAATLATLLQVGSAYHPGISLLAPIHAAETYSMPSETTLLAVGQHSFAASASGDAVRCRADVTSAGRGRVDAAWERASAVGWVNRRSGAARHATGPRAPHTPFLCVYTGACGCGGGHAVTVCSASCCGTIAGKKVNQKKDACVPSAPEATYPAVLRLVVVETLPGAVSLCVFVLGVRFCGIVSEEVPFRGEFLCEQWGGVESAVEGPRVQRLNLLSLDLDY